MKFTDFGFLGFLLLISCAPGVSTKAALSRSALEGRWAGVLRVKGARYEAVPLRIEPSGSAGAATATTLNPEPRPIAVSYMTRNRIRIRLPDGGDTLALIGSVSDSELEGIVTTTHGHSGSFELRRLATVAPESLSRLRGLYEYSPGRFVVIGATPAGLVAEDHDTGDLRELFPMSSVEFFAGPTLGIALPEESHISFSGSGDSLSLAWRSGKHFRKALRIKFREEEVSFRNGDVTLAGTLVLPRGPGPFPAAVRTHGGGPQRRNVRWAESSAYEGVASLTFDKRGSGASTGSWRASSMYDLAADAVSAVEYLKGRPDIDAGRIGITGGSQAGWVNVIAASKSPDIRFMVLGAGEVLPVLDNMVGETETEMQHDGFAASEIARAVPVRRAMFLAIAEAGRAGDWSRVDSITASVREERWYDYVRAPRKESPTVQWLVKNVSVDTRALWARLRIPFLGVYGGKDREVKADRTVPLLRKLLAEAGNPDYTVVIFPTIGHEQLETINGYFDEAPLLKRYPPGYFELFSSWTRQHTR